MSDLERWCKRFSDSNISFAKQHQFPQIVHLLFDCQWSDHVMNIYQLLVPICVWAVKLLLLIESVERREDLNIAASVHPSTFCFVFRLFDVWIKYWRRPLEPIYHFMDIWFPSRATVNFNFTLACSLDVALEVSQVSFLVVFFVSVFVQIQFPVLELYSIPAIVTILSNEHQLNVKLIWHLSQISALSQIGSFSLNITGFLVSFKLAFRSLVSFSQEILPSNRT